MRKKISYSNILDGSYFRKNTKTKHKLIFSKFKVSVNSFNKWSNVLSSNLLQCQSEILINFFLQIL